MCRLAGPWQRRRCEACPHRVVVNRPGLPAKSGMPANPVPVQTRYMMKYRLLGNVGAIGVFAAGLFVAGHMDTSTPAGQMAALLAGASPS